MQTCANLNSAERPPGTQCPAMPCYAFDVPTKGCNPRTAPLGCEQPLVRWENFFCGSLEHAVFVQVGANDGKGRYDPVWHYATRCRWRGVALEPVNATFQKLQRSYFPFGEVVPVRAAVSDHSGEELMVTGIGWSGEAARFTGNAREQKWRAGKRPKERVPVLTLEQVWKMPPVLGASRVDVLVVDAEGEEAKILERPLPPPLPELILFEYKHLLLGPQASINASLERQGYTLVSRVSHGRNPGDLLFARSTCLRNKKTISLVH